MAKKRIIVSYENLDPKVIEALNKKYPDGFENHVFKVEKGNGDFFYGVTVDTDEISYLIKVPVKIDAGFDDDSDSYDSSVPAGDDVVPDDVEDDGSDDEEAPLDDAVDIAIGGRDDDDDDDDDDDEEDDAGNAGDEDEDKFF